MTKKRLLKPSTVMTKWKALCKKVKEDSTRRRAPGRVQARQTAALAGMKSMGEVRCAADMDKRGIKWMYEYEKLVYQHNPQEYTPDFTLYADNDMLIEYKGKMTDETRKKLLSIKRSNPERRLCIVFEQPNNKLSARPNASRYWQWAEKSGFEWSNQLVDEAWFE
jgi:hypothetical protein